MKAMKVSRDSWHYRYWKFLHDPLPGKGIPRKEPPRPTNLCRYFWETVGRSLSLPVAGIILAAVAVVVFPIILVVGLAEDWNDRRRARKGKLPKERGEKGIVRQYLAARKAKVCPLIEVVR